MDRGVATGPVFLQFVDWYFAVTMFVYLTWSSACGRIAEYSLHCRLELRENIPIEEVAETDMWV
jgi:hypothetical protein